MWIVYILKCIDGTHYTGYTTDLADRLERHEKGEITHTSSRLPVQLVTYITFSDKFKALPFEEYLKSGSGKAFSQKRFL
jgi:putative endonuclease